MLRIRKITFTNNSLTELDGVENLLFVFELVLDRNKIRSLERLKILKQLRRVSATDNRMNYRLFLFLANIAAVVVIESFQGLFRSDSLLSLSLQGNPVASLPSYHSQLAPLFLNLKTLDNRPFLSSEDMTSMVI